jgi:hypothetical protein
MTLRLFYNVSYKVIHLPVICPLSNGANGYVSVGKILDDFAILKDSRRFLWKNISSIL